MSIHWGSFTLPTAYMRVQMVVRQPSIVVREGAVEESRLAAVRLRQLLPTVDIDRWVSRVDLAEVEDKWTNSTLRLTSTYA